MDKNTLELTQDNTDFAKNYLAQNPTEGVSLSGNKLTSKYLENYSPVSYLSSANAENTVNEKMSKVDGQYPQINTTSKTNSRGEIINPTEEDIKQFNSKYTTEKGKATYINGNEQEITLSESQLKDPKTKSYLKNNGYDLLKSDFAVDLESDVNNLDSQIEDLTNDFNSYNVNDDPEYQAEAQQIRQKYDKLRTQTQKTNASRKNALTTLGIRGGTAEFAGAIQIGIEGEELNQANQRLADIESEEASTLSSLRSAYKEGKWTEFSRKTASLEKIREKKADALKTYNETLSEKIKTLQETERQSTRDNTIASLIQQGVTDPVSLLDYLNYDEIGNQVGDFTAKEVADTLENLSKGAGMTADKLTGEVKNYFVLKDIPGALPSSITSLPREQQLGAYLQWEKNLTTSKAAQEAGYTGEGGFEQFSNESIALSVIPSTLRNSDVELKRYLSGIKLGLEQGKTPYEIADNLMGYKIENPDAFSDGLRPYLSMANLNGPEIANVARLINGGQKSSAIALLENKILENQKKIDPESYVGEATPRYYAEKVKQIKDTIEKAGIMDSIGPIEGSINSVFGMIPLSKRREAAKIQAQVTSLVSEMRNHLSGTSVTESEKKFLEPLVASLYDKKGIFLNKLDEISSNSLMRYNQTRQAGGLPILDVETILDRSKRVGLYENGSNFGMDNEIDNEIQAQKDLTNYLTKNPTKADEIEKLITDMETKIKRQISASEFYEKYPNYK